MKKKKAAPDQESSPKNNQRNSNPSTGEINSKPRISGRQTKTERAYLLIVTTPKGVTENDILRACYLASGRNYTNQLEKAAQIQLRRISEPNPDGIGSHYRYQIRSAQDAYSVALIVSNLMVRRGANPLTENEIRTLTRPYAGDVLQYEKDQEKASREVTA